jgi:putative lysine transport system permease protein
MSSWQKILLLLERYGALFLQGVGTTLLLALTGIMVGLILGMGLALIRNIKILEHDRLFQKTWKRALRVISTVYIEVFRGTPMMVQAIIIYFGGKMIGIPWTYLSAGLVIISLNTTAYMAEIIRAGINGIDEGQIEASRSLGMSHFKTMIFVVFPQALKNSIPTISNEFIINIKDSSVLNVITVSELFMAATIASSATYFFVESYLIIAVIYLSLTLTFSQLLKVVEKYLNLPYEEKPKRRLFIWKH